MQNVFESDKLNIKNKVMGMISNNVYLLESESEKVIVDPSCKAHEIIEYAGGNDISKILITHYHFDHTGAANELRNLTKAKTYTSITDSKNIEAGIEDSFPNKKVEACPIDVKLSEGDIVNIGSTTWRVIETPGHTMGCICFYSEDAGDIPILICGDTLFKYSMGRVDFLDSSPKAMQESLAKLSKLPDETLVLPGHEEFTTIGHERNFMLPN